MVQQHKSFTQSGTGIGLLKQFLSNKFPENEEWTKMLSSPKFSLTAERKGDDKDLTIELMDNLNIWRSEFEE
jgi:hypothetical protein